jgi:hypothetical protein
MSGKDHLKVTRAGGGLFVNGSNMKTEVVWSRDLRLSRAEGPFQHHVNVSATITLNAFQKERLGTNEFLEYSQDNIKEIKLRIINNELTLVRLRPEAIEMGTGAGLLVCGNEKDIKRDFRKSEVVALIMQKELLDPIDVFVSKHNVKVNAQKDLQILTTQLSDEGFEPQMSF